MIEEQFVSMLSALLGDRLFLVAAPEKTPLPYGAWEQVGGIPVNYVDGSTPNRRHARIQLHIWAGRYADAVALMLQAQDLMRTAPGLAVELDGEFANASAPELGRWGVRQDFSVWGPR